MLDFHAPSTLAGRKTYEPATPAPAPSRRRAALSGGGFIPRAVGGAYSLQCFSHPGGARVQMRRGEERTPSPAPGSDFSEQCFYHPGGAPVQMCKYMPGCSRPDPCPLHKYSQSIDPTLTPFIRRHERFVGERAMRKQVLGTTPSADEVRVSARRGAGLHESVPTDMRGEIAKDRSAAGAGAMSGARSSTKLTLFRGGVGHTNMFGGPGGTHTKGQAAMHDEQRKAYGKLRQTATTPESMASGVAHSFLDVVTRGDDIMDEPSLTDATPKYTGIPLKRPRSDSRKKLADDLGGRVEHMKRRVKSFDEQERLQPLRPVSPRRDFGPDRPPSPVPIFDGTTDEEITANQTAWMFGPMRE